tara:strand:- start:2423 stop:2896 length:474 start_codon:yes stop_codon:yes gene_type:complete
LPVEFTFLTDREFKAKYRFPKATFAYIDFVLEPVMSATQRRERRWGGRRQSVPSGVMIANSIRMLAGGSHYDISSASGIHPSSLYKHLWKFIDALLGSDLGNVVFFYDDLEWLDSQARTFTGTSPLSKKCVGALDGLAVRIRKPQKDECPRDYRYVN